MNDPNDLAAFLRMAWQRLSRGVADRRAPARHPVFATVSPEGWPEARTVVLRAASESRGTVEVHTDITSLKIADLRHTPRAALHVWDSRAKLQIRLSTTVQIETGEAVADRWNSVPDVARVSYGTRPDPGQPIPSVYAYEKPSTPERFAVLTCQIERMDLVELAERHRRARFLRLDGWAGQWLAP